MSNKWSSVKKRQKRSARIKRYEIKDTKVTEIAAPAASPTVSEEPSEEPETTAVEASATVSEELETLSDEEPETVPSDDESE